jgi:cysteine-rich repeat protein
MAGLIFRSEHPRLGEENSVINTGHSPEDVSRIVREVIARHNETVAVPKLRFAGFSNKKWMAESKVPQADLDGGITFLSFRCEDLNSDNHKNFCGVLSNPDVHACGNMVRKPNSPPPTKAWVMLMPAGCEAIDTPADKWTLSGNPDLAQVMLHEIGHTLGLQHANATQAQCEAGGNVHVGDPDGANGVMQRASPSMYPAFRSWRRDDLAGLDHLYQAATGPFELAWLNDDAYPDYPPEDGANSLADMNVSRSAVVSNRPNASWQVLATTAPDGRVLHRVLDAAGNPTPALADTVVDPSPSGRTWATPAAAASGDLGSDPRIFVAWFANEEPDSTSMDLRVATRSASDLAWTFENHPDSFRVNRLAATFLPNPEAFVVTTMMENTSEIALLLFDTNGTSLGPVMVLEGISAFDVGSPICTESRCLIPYSEPIFGGPDFGLVEVEFAADESAVTVIGQELIPSLDTRGRLALLEDTQGLLATIGAGRLALGSYPGIVPDGTLVELDGDWPLGLGHWTEGTTDHWRMFQPRGVACGDGIVQAGESCDDANDIAGDGCDACVLEPEDDSDASEGGKGNDEVGDYGGSEDPGQEGCECRASRTRAPVGVSTLLGLLAIRRRRTQ